VEREALVQAVIANPASARVADPDRALLNYAL
jgi:hypothetical protein